ncbi:MAG: DUF1467 family protein [Maricaulaceae bacterium]
MTVRRGLGLGLVALAGLAWFASFALTRPIMGPVAGVAVFIIVWWVCLFTVLPFGVRRPSDPDTAQAGWDPGAPAGVDVAAKAWATTQIAAGVWLLVYVLLQSGALSLELFDQLPAPQYDIEPKSDG